jgi:hypothetical protein
VYSDVRKILNTLSRSAAENSKLGLAGHAPPTTTTVELVQNIGLDFGAKFFSHGTKTIRNSDSISFFPRASQQADDFHLVLHPRLEKVESISSVELKTSGNLLIQTAGRGWLNRAAPSMAPASPGHSGQYCV